MYWQDKGTPDVDYDYLTDDYVSVRVVVKWQWENALNNTKPEELRFARYHWGDNYWSIEGVSGHTTVLKWLDLNKIP